MYFRIIWKAPDSQGGQVFRNVWIHKECRKKEYEFNPRPLNTVSLNINHNTLVKCNNTLF